MNYVSSTVEWKNGNNICYKYKVLIEWCEELQKGKDWLENQWKIKCKECEELQKQIKKEKIIDG